MAAPSWIHKLLPPSVCRARDLPAALHGFDEVSKNQRRNRQPKTDRTRLRDVVNRRRRRRHRTGRRHIEQSGTRHRPKGGEIDNSLIPRIKRRCRDTCQVCANAGRCLHCRCLRCRGAVSTIPRSRHYRHTQRPRHHDRRERWQAMAQGKLPRGIRFSHTFVIAASFWLRRATVICARCRKKQRSPF